MKVAAGPAPFDTAKLSEFLNEHFPELSDLKIVELSGLGGGWETDLYLVGLSSAESARLDLVLRLYGGADPKEKAQKEFELMTGVTSFGIHTPQIVALATDNSILGGPFIVMELIAGGTLEMSVQKGGVDWVDPMMQVFAEIHSLPWMELLSTPGYIIPRPDDPQAYVAGLLGEMDNAIKRFRLIDFEPTISWLRERQARGAATEPVLIHNDYHPQNILLRDDSFVVIDWSFAEVGDYRMDLAWSVLLSGIMLGQEHRSALLEAYARASGNQVEHFEYFEALKFTMRMVTIATWLDEAVQIPVPGITKQAIRGDYKVHVLNPYRRLKEITELEIRTIEEL